MILIEEDDSLRLVAAKYAGGLLGPAGQQAGDRVALEPIIRIEQLTFTYEGARRPALKEVDLAIWPGGVRLADGP